MEPSCVMDNMRVTIALESKDPCFGPVCWYVHTLDPWSDAVATVVNSREVTRKVVFMTSSAASTAIFEDHTIDYNVESCGPFSTDGKPEMFRTLKMRGKRQVIETLITRAVEKYRDYVSQSGDDPQGVPYWSWDSDVMAWTRSRSRPARPLSTLFLGHEARDVVDDFKHFCSPPSLDMYRTLHINPSRVYMFHGVPGSGKSSTVHCIASETGHGVAVMTPSMGLTDSDLAAAFKSVPPRCVLCIDEVDCISKSSGITLAGILSALDTCGQEQGSGLGVFLTTNTLCTLDPAIRRRLDYVIEYGLATKQQAKQLFERFFPYSHSFEHLWQRIHTRGFAMSVLQKYLVKSLQHGDPLKDLELFETLATCAAGDRGDTAHLYA